jgi:hypothetical protein
VEVMPTLVWVFVGALVFALVMPSPYSHFMSTVVITFALLRNLNNE